MKRLLAPMLVLAIVAVARVACADENPTGTWKWEMMIGQQKLDVTLKLKLEGDKLTGTISGRNNDTAISDATYKDGDLAFSVTRERNGQKFTRKYSGKVSGDAIKGKMEFERNGEAQSQPWEAKRAKE